MEVFLNFFFQMSFKMSLPALFLSYFSSAVYKMHKVEMGSQ